VAGTSPNSRSSGRPFGILRCACTHSVRAGPCQQGYAEYFPPQPVRAANSFLRDKVLFGSDFPPITPDRWLADFAALEIKPDVRPLILKDNAARVLGLSDG
jgi:hypothetical protein